MSIPSPSQSKINAGTIDTRFGAQGVVSIDVPGAQSSVVNGITSGPNDELYVCGNATLEGSDRFFITCLDSEGNVNPQFGDNGFVIDTFNDDYSYGSHIIFLDTGKLVLFGAAYIGRDTFPALARLGLDGKFDPDFGENDQGKVVIHISGPDGTPPAKARATGFEQNSATRNDTGSVNILADGKILLSHYFVLPGWPSYGLIIRLLSDGSLDPIFNRTGYVKVIAPGYEHGQTQIENVTVDLKGRYVGYGAVYDMSSPPSTMVVRYNQDGSPDSLFGADGFVIIPSQDGPAGGTRSEQLCLSRNGGIISAGSSILDPYYGRLIALKDNGEMNPEFNDGKPLDTQLASSSTLWKGVTLQSDGKIIVVGAVDKTQNSHTFDIALARFDEAGNLDAEFNGGLGWTRTRLSLSTDGVYAVALQSSGKIVIAGFSNQKAVVLRYYG
jgi:uncharacterized delta-60 repeat protein